MTVPLMILASLFPGGLSALRCESKRVSIAVRGGPPVHAHRKPGGVCRSRSA